MDSHNDIPHRQLFHKLKQKYSDLKDCDIYDSMQKHGLNQKQCELTLQQKCINPTIRYVPWRNRRNTTPQSTTTTLSPTSTLSSPCDDSISKPQEIPYPSKNSGACAKQGCPQDSSVPGNSSYQESSVLEEQIVRRNRLEQEINNGIQEKFKLNTDVVIIERNLHLTKEKYQQVNNANRKEIEDIHVQNQDLRYLCNQMEVKILQNAPVTELNNAESSGYALPNDSFSTPAESSLRDYTGSSRSTTPAPPSVGLGHFIPTPPPQNSPILPANHTAASRRVGVPDDPDSSKKWTCTYCTFDNNYLMQECELCKLYRSHPFSAGYEPL